MRQKFYQNISPLYKDLTSQRLKIKRLKFNSNIFRYIASQITKDTSELKKNADGTNKKNERTNACLCIRGYLEIIVIIR